MSLLRRQALAVQPQFGWRWNAYHLFLVSLLLSACSGLSNLTSVVEGPLGTVALERLTSRGTTAKYSGPVSSFPSLASSSLVGFDDISRTRQRHPLGS